MVKPWKRICGALALVVAMGMGSLAQAQFGNDKKNDPSSPTGGTLGASQTRTFRVGVVVTPKNGICTNVVATIPVPTNWTEQEVKVSAEEFAPSAKVTYRPGACGLQQMIVEIPFINPGEACKVVLVLDITKSAILAPSDTTIYHLPKDPPKDVRIYLGTSPRIESTNPKIKTLAKELMADHETDWEKVEGIYKGVREKVALDPTEMGRKGAIGALKDGKANRDDLTALFVACCRAQKIPARFVWVTDSCYAEFYLEESKGKGAWFPAQVAGEKEEFGFVTETRPIWQKGDNIKVPEKKEPQTFVPETMTAKGGSPSVEFVRRVESAIP